MTRNERIIILQNEYRRQFKVELPKDVTVAVARDWERTGCPPEFLDAVNEKVIRTYHPLYELVQALFHKVRR